MPPHSVRPAVRPMFPWVHLKLSELQRRSTNIHTLAAYIIEQAKQQKLADKDCEIFYSSLKHAGLDGAAKVITTWFSVSHK